MFRGGAPAIPRGQCSSCRLDYPARRPSNPRYSNDGDYSSKTNAFYCQDAGIKHDYTLSYDPQHKRAAARVQEGSDYATSNWCIL